jgi:hypothetical protein
MRNSTSGNDSERRQAVVIYLSDDAKEVLWRNRQRRRLLDVPPMLDSTLIEELLLAFGSQSKDGLVAGGLVRDETVGHSDTSKLLSSNEGQAKRIKALELHNFVAEETISLLNQQIEDANEFRPFDWSQAGEDLLSAHRHLMSHTGYQLAIRLRDRLINFSNDSTTVKIFDEEISDYLKCIVDMADKT